MAAPNDILGLTADIGDVYLIAGTIRRNDADDVVVVLGKDRTDAIRVRADEVMAVEEIIVRDGSRPFTDNVGCNAANPTAVSHLTHKAYVDGQITATVFYAAATFQPLDATLTALAGISTSADQLIYATGSDSFAMASLTPFGRSLVDDADASAARTTLGMGTSAAIQSLAKPIYRVSIHAHGTAALGLTDMAEAEDWLGNSRIATLVDLANYSQCRLVVRLVSSSSSSNSPRLRVRYKTGAYSSTISLYSDIGTSEVAVALDQSSGLYSSGWVTLDSDAQVDDVNLAVTEIGGDGVADPSVGSVAVEFR